MEPVTIEPIVPACSAKCKKYEQQATMEATLASLEAPVQPEASGRDDDTYALPTPSQASPATRPHSAQVCSGSPFNPALRICEHTLCI